MVDPARYAAEVAGLRHKFLAKESTALDALAQRPGTTTASKTRIKSRKAANTRLIKLWMPSSKRLVLHGLLVKDADGSTSVVSDPQGITQGLTDFWKPVFSKQSTDEPKARSYAKRFAGSWKWRLASRPKKPAISKVL